MAGIFGESRKLSEEEEEFLLKITKESPVRVFQVFNKHVRTLNLMITIDAAPSETAH